MPKTLHLNKRVKGPWTNFECQLLKPENTHVGWIEWIDDRHFRLKKNPFVDHPSSPFIYELPDELKIPTEEGLIRVDIDKIVKEINLPRKRTFGNYTNQYCTVDKYEPLKQDELPKPHLTKDDFLNKLIQSWAGDKSIMFSKEVAINILSCPKSSYGTGGIGAQSFTPYGSKKDLISLNKYVRGLLPAEFLKRNKKYEYKPISTTSIAEQTNRLFKGGLSDEISYNYLFTLSPQMKQSMLSTQIPIIMPEVKYTSDKLGLDRDILDYHMGAMLFTPYIEEMYQDRILDIITRTGKDMLRKSSLQLPLDASGLLRLAYAWCRLELKTNIDEEDFRKMKNDLEPIYRELFDVVEDAKLSGKTYNIPLTQTTHKTALSINANKVYKEVKKLSRESNIRRIPRKNIRAVIPQKEISDYDLEKALSELVNTGYLLSHKNKTEFETAN